MSINSAAPLHQQHNPIDTGYPPVSNPPAAGLTPVHERRVQFNQMDADVDVEANKEGASYSEMPAPDPAGGRGHTSKSPSWDILAGYKKFEHSYEEFDTRKASEKHLVFADGDVPNSAVSAKFLSAVVDLTLGGVPQIVRPILPLSFERFNHHSLVYFYRSCTCDPLDPWHPSFHNIPRWKRKLFAIAAHGPQVLTPNRSGQSACYGGLSGYLLFGLVSFLRSHVPSFSF